MGSILRGRLGTTRDFHPGEELLLALGIAAGELGAPVNGILREHGLTPARYNALRILRGAGDAGLTCGDLADRLLLPAPDLTRLVDPLAQQGWVRRDRAPEDRRIVIQRLTSVGARLLDDVAGPLRAYHRQIVDVVGAHRAARLVAACERVIELGESGALKATSAHRRDTP